jgi:hypothetical protein
MTATKTTIPTCPGCNALPCGHLSKDNMPGRVWTCGACGAYFNEPGDATTTEFLAEALSLDIERLVDGEAKRYFDLFILRGVAGPVRFHGWVNESGKLVQTG